MPALNHSVLLFHGFVIGAGAGAGSSSFVRVASMSASVDAQQKFDVRNPAIETPQQHEISGDRRGDDGTGNLHDQISHHALTMTLST
jgi:hypothetical protein